MHVRDQNLFVTIPNILTYILIDWTLGVCLVLFEKRNVEVVKFYTNVSLAIAGFFSEF